MTVLSYRNDPPPIEKTSPDTGLLSLLLMASLHGIAADGAQLKHAFGQAVFTRQTVLLAARQLGLTAKLVRQAPERLAQAPLPAPVKKLLLELLGAADLFSV